jgi:hypothetical protein
MITHHLVHRLEAIPEGTLAKPRAFEVTSPDKIWVAEHNIDWRRIFVASELWMRQVWSTNDASCTYDIEHDLNVESPISRIMEHEDGAESCLGEIRHLRRP